MSTDTSERGLERLICTALTGHPCDPAQPGQTPIPTPASGGSGWIGGQAYDYDREYCVDLAQLSTFLRATQPEAAKALNLDEDSPTRRTLLARLQGEITRRGTIDVLRHGVKHGPHNLDLFYGTPSPDNQAAIERYKKNETRHSSPLTWAFSLTACR
jgi:type I restriction enzyme R subunit